MPNCFRLIDRETGNIPTLVQVDAILCENWNTPCDPVKYFEHWVDLIGMPLAMGKTWEDVREQWADDPYLLPIIDFLEARYTVEAWAER